MSVVLARVDDRLIHGQVVVGWMRALKANSILVINDAVAADPLQKSLLPLAVPPEVRVRISRVADSVAMSQAGEADESLILLFSNPVDVLGFVRAGGEIRELNIGGMRFGPGKRQVDPAISLGEVDIQALKALKELEIPMTVQMVPDEKGKDIFELIEQASD